MTKKRKDEELTAKVEQPVEELIATVETGSENPSDAVDASVETVDDPTDGVQGTVMNTAITVVIPFFKAKNVVDEVLMLIRSITRYLREEVRIVVVGDRIDSDLDCEVEQIEYKDAAGTQSDFLEVLKLAVVSESVSGKFILMEPGTYLIDDVGLCHLELGKHLGLLNPGRYNGADAVLMKATADVLRDTLRVAAYDYNTHCPVVLDKEKLTDMFEEFPDILTGKYHVLTVYFCAYATHPVRLDYKTDGWILPVVSLNPDKKTVERLVTGKCFLYLKYFQNVELLTPFLA